MRSAHQRAALLLLNSAAVWPTPSTPPSLLHRQVPPPPIPPSSTSSTNVTPAATSSAASHHSTGSTFRVIIPVAVGASVLILLVVIIFAARRPITKWWKKHVSSTPTGTAAPRNNGSSLSLPPSSAEGRVSTTRSDRRVSTARRGRRNVRRTESGHSVKTLPEYSKEAGDEELVLVRQRATSDISEVDDDFSDEGDIGNTTDQALLPSTGISRSASGRSARSVSEDPSDGEVQQVERPTSPPGPQAPHSAPAGSTLSRAIGSIGSLTRRGWGEAPTYLEAMSSPDFHDIEAEAGVPPPRSSTPLARRGTGLRELISRGFISGSFRVPNRQRPMSERPRSQTSLLLQPQTSRISTQTGGASTYASPWASTHSLNISSPVPNSAVRASFEMPRAGLSDDQMRFLGSSEAVNVAGVKLGEPPVGRGRRRSEAARLGNLVQPDGEGEETIAPPSWEQVDGERRRNEAEVRRGLGRPAGSEDERVTPENPATPEPTTPENPQATAGEAEAVPDTASPVTAGLKRPAALTLAPISTAPTVEIQPATPISPNPNAVSIK